jgi:hypothetical protein
MRMPSAMEIVGDVLGESLVVPLVVGGAVVALIASPAARARVREWGVKGMAAVMAAGELASRQGRAVAAGETGAAAQGMMTQVSDRFRRAAAGMRQGWERFVADAQAERERMVQQMPAGARAGHEPDGQRPGSQARGESGQSGQPEGSHA